MRRILLVYLIIASIVIISCIPKEKSIEEKIKERLVGEKITYFNIAGQPLNFTVSAKDILSIEKAEIKGEALWKARVGQDLAWDIYLDKGGKNIVKKEQLFVT